MTLKITAFVVAFLLSVTLCQAKRVCLGKEVKRAFVRAHNEVRKTVGCPGVKWDDHLELLAGTKVPASRCSTRHTTRKGYGENLYWRSPATNDLVDLAQQAVDSWAKEVEFYRGRNLAKRWQELCFPNPPPPNHKQCGHYLQVVWKNTKKIGCAVSKCKDESNIVVCTYHPVGNMAGEDAY